MEFFIIIIISFIFFGMFVWFACCCFLQGLLLFVVSLGVFCRYLLLLFVGLFGVSVL